MTPQKLFVHTDKSIIPAMPRFVFEGRIVVIQTAGEARRAVAYLRTFPLLGIDSETRPSFRRGVVHEVALLQVSTKDTCFLFRLNRMGFIAELAELLSDISTIKVGLSLKDDFHALKARREDFEPRNYIELQTMASEMGIKDMSLQKLFANVFHKRISKNAQLSNWEADVLSESQKKYAATDAYSCILLYERLHELRRQRSYLLIEPQPEPAFNTVPAAVNQ